MKPVFHDLVGTWDPENPEISFPWIFEDARPGFPGRHSNPLWITSNIFNDPVLAFKVFDFAFCNHRFRSGR